MKRLAEVKDSLDIDVKQNFIDPLQGLCDKDLREIQVHNACFLLQSSSNSSVSVFVKPRAHIYLFDKNDEYLQ